MSRFYHHYLLGDIDLESSNDRKWNILKDLPRNSYRSKKIEDRPHIYDIALHLREASSSSSLVSTSSVFDEHAEFAAVLLIQHLMKEKNMSSDDISRQITSICTTNFTHEESQCILKQLNSFSPMKETIARWIKSGALCVRAVKSMPMPPSTTKKKKTSKKRSYTELIKASTEILTVIGPSKYNNVRKVLKKRTKNTSTLLTLKDAKKVQEGLCTEQVIMENDTPITYLPNTLQHDPTADKTRLGHSTRICNNPYRSSQQFGIHLLSSTQWKGETVSDMYKAIFDLNCQINIDDFIEDIESRLYDESGKMIFSDYDDQQNKFEKLPIPEGSRLEIRIACKDHVTALQFYDIIVKFTKYKSKSCRIFRPYITVKQNRYITSNPYHSLVCHVKDILSDVDIDTINDPITVKCSIVCHFDSIFHKDAITPFDMHLCIPSDSFVSPRRSDPMPLFMFAGADNHIMDHFEQQFLDLLRSVEETIENPIHKGNKIRVEFSMGRTIVKSDGCPRNKITGIKGGGHILRYSYGLESGAYTDKVLIQNEKMCYRLGDYYDEYEKQIRKERNLKKQDINLNEQYFSSSPALYGVKDAIPGVRDCVIF